MISAHFCDEHHIEDIAEVAPHEVSNEDFSDTKSEDEDNSVEMKFLPGVRDK